MSSLRAEFLKSEGIINPKPESVSHPLFTTNEFFDPLDLPQVRYEMLRAARVDKMSVAGACKLLGFSREYFYRLERMFKERGYIALLGSPKGGRPPLLALNQEIINFIIHRRFERPDLSGEQMHQEILKHYKVDCSRRTVERIIEKMGIGKKGLLSTSR
ncbi:MAG: helix-turn-helix domain-containing protein [Proteobacteria bacterium]|nr:helix-turn-helix domain-containing protein [Pseudomonadota bacterium]